MSKAAQNVTRTCNAKSHASFAVIFFLHEAPASNTDFYILAEAVGCDRELSSLTVVSMSESCTSLTPCSAISDAISEHYPSVSSSVLSVMSNRPRAHTRYSASWWHILRRAPAVTSSSSPTPACATASYC